MADIRRQGEPYPLDEALRLAKQLNELKEQVVQTRGLLFKEIEKLKLWYTYQELNDLFGFGRGYLFRIIKEVQRNG